MCDYITTSYLLINIINICKHIFIHYVYNVYIMHIVYIMWIKSWFLATVLRLEWEIKYMCSDNSQIYQRSTIELQVWWSVLLFGE